MWTRPAPSGAVVRGPPPASRRRRGAVLPKVSRRRHSLLPVGVIAAGMNAVCLAAVPAAALSTPPLTPPAEDTVLVTGTVDDLDTGRPVAQAMIVVMSADSVGARVATAESDSLGTFVLSVPDEGEYRVRVQRLGYGDAEETVRIDGPDVSLRASLVPEALDLEPVVVTVRRRRSPWMEEFERRRAHGFGSFVTRADLESRRHGRVTDALRQIPGLRVVSGSMGDGVLVMRGRCRPNIYIDGIATDPTTSLDLMLRPDDVEGIEIHSAATVPPQYAREGCGVVLVWTREPRRAAGKVDWWKPLVVAGALFTVIVLVR
jgi:hypothetical protein